MIQNVILTIASTIIDIYFWAMILYILSSWIPPLRESKFGEWIGRIVEPYLGLFRKFIPPIGMIDFSPIFAFIAYRYITGFAFNGLAAILNWIF